MFSIFNDFKPSVSEDGVVSAILWEIEEPCPDFYFSVTLMR